MFRTSVSDRENVTAVLRGTPAACTHASYRAIVQKQSFVSYIAIALAGGPQAARAGVCSSSRRDIGLPGGENQCAGPEFIKGI
jgi:hypothetical protein